MAGIKKIILGVTGSIAAYKAADIIRRLQDKGFSVSVVMTKAAKHFITPLTLESLSGQKVYSKLFETKNREDPIKHISLIQGASAVLIAPATANIIGKIANGIADDLLSCTVLASRTPILIAPAMNEAMYNNEIVQANIAKLQNFGFRVI